MEQDLSAFPATPSGTRDLLRVLTPSITALWRAERDQHQTDDLVVIIDAHTNTVRMEPRGKTYDRLYRHDPKTSLLPQLSKRAPGTKGAITLWAIIGFTEGPVFIRTFRVARG